MTSVTEIANLHGVVLAPGIAMAPEKEAEVGVPAFDGADELVLRDVSFAHEKDALPTVENAEDVGSTLAASGVGEAPAIEDPVQQRLALIEQHFGLTAEHHAALDGHKAALEDEFYQSGHGSLLEFLEERATACGGFFDGVPLSDLCDGMNLSHAERIELLSEALAIKAYLADRIEDGVLDASDMAAVSQRFQGSPSVLRVLVGRLMASRGVVNREDLTQEAKDREDRIAGFTLWYTEGIMNLRDEVSALGMLGGLSAGLRTAQLATGAEDQEASMSFLGSLVERLSRNGVEQGFSAASQRLWTDLASGINGPAKVFTPSL